MFTKIERLGENEFAVFSLDGASPTAKFKRGTFKFDAENQTLSIAGADPLGIPGPACLTEGTEILFHLYNAKTGAARPQFRVIKLEAVKNQENVLVARGTPKTPPKFTAEEGWHPKTYKFRVYATHPGVETDHPQPDWLKDHILKTRACWNRVSWLCREARRACFANVQDRLKSFRDDQLLPKIEEFNRPLRKDKLSFPKGMDRDYLDVGSFLRYTGYLKFLKAESKPFPEDLLAVLTS